MQRNNDYSSARIVNVVLGAWLFISAFAWPHSAAQMTNTWILAVAIVVVAFLGTRTPQMRFVNTAVSVWLVISAFVLPRLAIGTVWNNVLVGIAVFVVSLVGSYGRMTAAPRGT